MEVNPNDGRFQNESEKPEEDEYHSEMGLVTSLGSETPSYTYTSKESSDGDLTEPAYAAGSAIDDRFSDESLEKPNPKPIGARSHKIPDGFWARRAKAMARSPWMHFWAAFITALVLSVIGFVAGEFAVEADNKGWQSRGTLIANREAQNLLVRYNSARLAFGTETDWLDLIENVQASWQADDDDDTRRNLEQLPERSQCVPQPLNLGSSSRGRSLKKFPSIHVDFNDNFSRRVQSDDNDCGSGLNCCDIDWYQSEDLTSYERLWPIWKVAKGKSALDADVLETICEAEIQTTKELENLGLCFGCEDGRCLPPFSLVLFARLTVLDIAGTMSCKDLATEFSKHKDDVAEQFAACVSDIKSSGFELGEDELPESCPYGFSPVFVDNEFGPENLRIEYTSSIFPSFDEYESIKIMYNNAGRFGKGDVAVVQGAYDTQYESFVENLVDESLVNDMLLAMGSAAITAVAILVHTRSPWLTCIGLAQIIFSFPLAFFVYTFVGRLDFFPFLNFIGIFVVFALGADDVFVAVDKWKNARNAFKDGSTEDIAAIALPDAAGAMFLTTITTAVAFFGTAVCPVTPLKAFAVFCGLLIVFDYIMCVILIFPALCLYDKWLKGGRAGRNRCVSCHFAGAYTEAHGTVDGDYEEKPSLIRRILQCFYKYVHMLRWVLLVGVLTAFGFTAYRSSQLALPNSSDVRLLSTSYEYEQNFEWRLRLLYDSLTKAGGSRGFIIWGVKAADTGNHNDPNTWTQLVLDEEFDPSSEEAQKSLRGFCDRLFALDEADPVSAGFVCPINEFEGWLGEQSVNGTSSGYLASCNGASSLPIPKEDFHACIGAFQEEQSESRIMLRNGEVKIMTIEFQARVRFDSPYDDLDREWKALEEFMDGERTTGPPGLAGAYHSSEDFWWYDTNGQMLSTAYSAASIALAAAAVVVLFSTRSVVLTIFCLLTIGFVLTSTTTMLIASGWTLGFLESVCFAILIGISCDFVIHFGHAYSHMTGDVNRHDRTKHALITMGPSILAAAFTTICAAAIMIFTVISFFQKFAFILFYSILNATIASFIMFNVLTDSVGPSQPTYLMDTLVRKLCACSQSARSVQEEMGDTELTKAPSVVANPGINAVEPAKAEPMIREIPDDEPGFEA